MGRHCVVRHAEAPRDLTGGKPMGLLTHENTKDLQPRGLCKGRKCIDSERHIHLSRLIDRFCDSCMKVGLRTWCLRTSGEPSKSPSPRLCRYRAAPMVSLEQARV